MTVRLLLVPALLLLLGTSSPGEDPPRQKDKTVESRVSELIGVIGKPDARSDNLDATVKALEELRKIGGPAAPQLVEAAIGHDISVAAYAKRVLVKIGRPALPAVHARWGDFNDEQRWKLMPLREKVELAAVREYAWNCLDANSSVRLDAWQFMMRTKDPRAKERYFEALASYEAPGVRWHLLPGDKPIYDKERENDSLITLLEPDSWAAKGDGQIPGNRRPAEVQVCIREGVELSAMDLRQDVSGSDPGHSEA